MVTTVNFKSSRESAYSYGRIIECRLYRKLSEAVARPHSLISPFWSRTGFLTQAAKFFRKISALSTNSQEPFGGGNVLGF